MVLVFPLEPILATRLSTRHTQCSRQTDKAEREYFYKYKKINYESPDDTVVGVYINTNYDDIQKYYYLLTISPSPLFLLKINIHTIFVIRQ